MLQRGLRAGARQPRGARLRSATQIAAGQHLDIELADGHVSMRRPSGSRASRRAEPQPQVQLPPRKRTADRVAAQGSLF